MRPLLTLAILSALGAPLAGAAEPAMPEHLREAFGVVAQADAAAEQGPAPKDYDSEAAAIGYVRASKAGRVPGEPLEGPGRTVVSGMAEVLSADLLRVGASLVRLQGVRAPDRGDDCRTASGTAFDCTMWATTSAGFLLADRPLTCALTEEVHASGGRIGWCDLSVAEGDTRDLGKTAVRAGLLLPSGLAGGVSPYLAAGLEAQSARRGLWSGSFLPACHGEEPCAETPETTLPGVNSPPPGPAP